MIRHPARLSLPLLAAVSLQLSACSTDSTTTLSSYAPSSGDTSAEQGWTLLPVAPEGAPIEAGDYALTAAGSVHSLAVVRAPAGFSRYDDWTFVAGEESETADEPFRAMGYMTTDMVFGDPCGSRLHRNDDTIHDAGDTVSDLAYALAAQKGAISSDPVPASIDGHAGLYLDYRVPDIDLTRCRYGEWDITPGWRLAGSGERAGIWVLDVDGQRVLLAWVAFPGVTSDQIEQMNRMVASTRFVDPR